MKQLYPYKHAKEGCYNTVNDATKDSITIPLKFCFFKAKLHYCKNAGGGQICRRMLPILVSMLLGSVPQKIRSESSMWKSPQSLHKKQLQSVELLWSRTKYSHVLYKQHLAAFFFTSSASCWERCKQLSWQLYVSFLPAPTCILSTWSSCFGLRDVAAALTSSAFSQLKRMAFELPQLD